MAAELDSDGRFRFTETNAYSGNNGRAAILNDSTARNVLYTAGNAGNGSNPQPDGIVLGAGAQIIEPPLASPKRPAARARPRRSAASASPSWRRGRQDRQGHQFPRPDDLQQRRLLHQGSGGNGVNTVYFVDTTGKACPSGVGPGARRAAAWPSLSPTNDDIYNPRSCLKDALLQPESRECYQRLLAQGWTDSVRACYPEDRIYTFWDYFRQHWQKDSGLRIDHLLLNAELALGCGTPALDRWVRDRPHASDHAPTWIALDMVPQCCPK